MFFFFFFNVAFIPLQTITTFQLLNCYYYHSLIPPSNKFEAKCSQQKGKRVEEEEEDKSCYSPFTLSRKRFSPLGVLNSAKWSSSYKITNVNYNYIQLLIKIKPCEYVINVNVSINYQSMPLHTQIGWRSCI